MTVTRALGLALVVQALLAVVTWWPSQPETVRPLFAFERDAIDEIEIAPRPGEGETEEAVVLARSEDGDEGKAWVIRSAGGYPAVPERVAELLDGILGLRAGPPVATRATSHASLSIDDASYGRRLTVRAGDEESTWLLAPATSRSVYARHPDEEEVFRATGASEWSFRDRPAAYWEPRYVEEDPSGFEAVAVQNENGSFRLEKRDGDWTLADLAEGEQLDPEAVASLLDDVSSLRMSEPVGRDAEPAYGLDGSVRVDWTIPAEDQSLSGGYAVGADVDSDAYVRAVGHPFVVRVSQAQVRPLREATRAGLLASGDGAS